MATKSLTREAAGTQGAPGLKTACLSNEHGLTETSWGWKKNQRDPSLHLAGGEVFPDHVTTWGFPWGHKSPS